MKCHQPEELCAACRGINIEDLASHRKYLHSPNFNALARSAMSVPTPCPLCVKFHTAFVPLASEFNLSQEDSTPLILHSKFHNLYAHFRPRQRRDRSSKRFKLWVPYDSPLTGLFSFRETGETPASKITYENLTRWTSECVLTHRNCQVDQDNILPSRVIDVGNTENQPRLHISDPWERSKYTALSYCWGNDGDPDNKALTTTPSTIQARLQGIPLESMPQTIRDAVMVTRKMNIKYLWVDALCILQGPEEESRKDWEIEYAKMQNVYGGAFLTISAASAAGAHEGFLHTPRLNRTLPSNPGLSGSQNSEDLPCAISYTTKAVPESLLEAGSTLRFRDIEVSGVFYIGQDYDTLIDNEEKDIGSQLPLDHRGWTLQESLLSTRLLRYGRTKIIWQCKQMARAEDTDGISISKYYLPIGPLDIQRLLSPGEKNDSYVKNDVLSIWNGMVEDFARRQFSFSTDKLPAFSGVANLFRSKVKWKEEPVYLAGLWSNFLPHSLLWYAPYKSRSTRLKQYVAPSWSWASVSNPGYNDWEHDIIAPSVKILHCQTQLVTPASPFGQVSSGSLTIQAKMRKVGHSLHIRPRPNLSESKTLDNDRILLSINPILPSSVPLTIGHLWLDDIMENVDENHTDGLWLLWLVDIQSSRIFGSYSAGLLLRSVGDRDKCVRVGYWRLFGEDSDWIKDGEVRIITII